MDELQAALTAETAAGGMAVVTSMEIALAGREITRVWGASSPKPLLVLDVMLRPPGEDTDLP